MGYLGNQIEEYFGNGEKFGLKICYSYEETPIGTGGALKNAKEKLTEEFLLLNGDTFLDIDYQDLISYFHKLDKIAA